MAFKNFIKDIKSYKNNLVFSLKYPEHSKVPFEIKSDDKHLKVAMEWLCRAQDATKCGGVSACYYLLQKKWGVPYRETTGYIIPTFLNYYSITGNEEFLKRVIKMGDWETAVQLDDGSVAEFQEDGSLVVKVFNTGQVILGLCSLFHYTKDEKYLLAAKKAADWLVVIQEKDGTWIKFTTQGPKTYHSRVAWSLLEIFQRTKDVKYRNAAEKNIDWILSQQNEFCWFDNTGLAENNKPWTHLIAYTLRGLLECCFILKRDENKNRIFDPVYKASEKILEFYNGIANNRFNYLPTTFDNNWRSNDKHSCLTGNAQIAIVWLKLYKETGEKRFYDAAIKLIDQLKETQVLKTNNADIMGGITGSYPVNKGYCPYMVLNWATKFFADALMMKMNQDIKFNG